MHGRLQAHDFAELAQAAVELGLLDAAQHMLAAAFALSNGAWDVNVDDVLGDIRTAAIAQGNTRHLSRWQKQLLDLDGFD